MRRLQIQTNGVESRLKCENVEEESGEGGDAEEAEPKDEPQPEDVELEIRDEDEGRPVSSLSKKVRNYLKTTVNSQHPFLFLISPSPSLRHPPVQPRPRART